MHINREKLIDLMNSECFGNYNRMARELEVDPSQLYRFVKTGVGGGKKMVGGLMKFCMKRELKFEEYIVI